MKKYLVIIIIVASGINLSAQSLWNLTYDMSVPMGATRDFISAGSFRGFGVDGRTFVNDNVTLGGSWSWNVFYESEVDKTLMRNQSTITGNTYEYGNYMPMMATGHYYFGADGGVRTFIGTGIGTIWKEEILDIGSFNASTDNAWQFGFAPEVGIYIPIAFTTTFFINAKYTYGVETGQLTPTSFFNFGIGFAWESY